MAVRDDWQGKGVGTAMMQAVVDLADKWLNLSRLELEVYTDNEPAMRLYQKFGFTIEGTGSNTPFATANSSICISWRDCASGKGKAMSTDYNFSDQVALITGGGRGLGQAFAEALAQAGATVAIVARSEDQLRDVAQTIEQAGGRALTFAADVTDRQAIEQVVAEVEQQLGHIDLLVNTAGVFRALGPIAEVDPDEWWREVEINVRGTFLCARAVLPGMVARGRGRIINIASAAGLRALPTTSAYCLSKTAVIRFSESLAIENGDRGVCAFAMHPGTVRTPMTDYVVESDEIEAARAVGSTVVSTVVSRRR